MSMGPKDLSPKNAFGQIFVAFPIVIGDPHPCCRNSKLIIASQGI